MQVEVWSDVVCPWCYVGKRNLESALAQFAHADEVELVWRSFQLDRDAEQGPGESTAAALARKLSRTHAEVAQMQAQLTETAASVGLEYHLADTRSGNTADAHRLLHLARERGLQARLKERLLAAYFTEGQELFSHKALGRLAGEAGLDTDEVTAVLAGTDYAEAVQSDVDLGRSFGITGVPFFVVDRTYGVSGAQPVASLLEVLDQAWAASHPLSMATTGAGGACEGGSCAV